ncbi:hypothetical protein ACFX19_044829 [Malus domestica]
MRTTIKLTVLKHAEASLDLSDNYCSVRIHTGHRVYGFLVLRAASTLPNRQRFLQVKLVNYEEDRVTIIIDISNVYVVGFIAGNVRRHFKDCPLEVDYIALFPVAYN